MSTPPEPKGNQTSFNGLYMVTCMVIGMAIGAASGDKGLMAALMCIGTGVGSALDCTASTTKPSDAPVGLADDNDKKI